MTSDETLRNTTNPRPARLVIGRFEEFNLERKGGPKKTQHNK